MRIHSSLLSTLLTLGFLSAMAACSSTTPSLPNPDGGEVAQGENPSSPDSGPSDAPRACTSDNQCSPGTICVKTVCQAGCRTNSDCPPGTSCQSGSCSSGQGTESPGPDAGADAGPGEPAPDSGLRFSFFVTSIEAMRELSGSRDGFGGNLGGLAGADSICQKIAAKAGFGYKTWRAFLSVTKGPDGNPVNAIDRIGKGPWYDRNGRLLSRNIAGLLTERPRGDPQIVNDLPDEHGRGLQQFGDNHEVLTGSDNTGKLASADPASTCEDWTSAQGRGSGRPMCGVSWPRTSKSGESWISARRAPGCAAGYNLGGGDKGTYCVGCKGGYGAIYCFALTP